ncbi:MULTISPECIES: molybdopterin-dependent oxidoreductase [Bradyrhizobium]|uniref:molybdopterin-dependent oxidoreductase n=1 Tax=Bradyrhizobium TaxID=374 RepID=UPI001448A395|nr:MULTISPECIES: molybdopterin-dependent oxidoreductase [Bradyrhizobium]MCP1924690.1 biotin/methionine sulfoxide reductase [Bradyrhizobium elkanii]MCS3584553.1 biotin/methionine sulfoxide reductase [Bradyrhizobium elkanii]MCS3718130.1 biotin/methionine sulfoxide reductase [Bradyrhizobium elkanii]MCS4011838.1 biotin/methionine sulfoxide reductase [Bradyrhizobium elkanii USDA 61]QOZ19623.1 Asp-tRNA(Asn)/Glu-tRNA(Gln) amidotransferase GatCAB subunit C [Bradyrhizobium sp. CCBAU 21365]
MSVDGRRFIQTASHWGVYNVEADPKGELFSVTPFDGDPYPATYLQCLPELVRSPLRIDQPYVRLGYLRGGEKGARKRGGDSFVPVSWDRALAMVAGELGRVKADFGCEAIYGGSYGWASAGRLHHGPSVLKRLLGLHGGYVDKRGNHSFGAALGVMPYILGRSDITELCLSWEEIVSSTELVVLFGGASAKNAQIDAGGAVVHEGVSGYARASSTGVRFVNVSPSRADSPEEAYADWMPIRPNTDVALMLGLAYALVCRDIHNREFLSRYCEGYEKFEAYLLGETDGVPKSAMWAAAITGVSAEAIEQLAHRMLSHRTLIAASWSIQRADHGEQPVWMAVTLAAILGQIGLPGGGFSLGLGAVNGLTAPRVEGMPRPTLPLGQNPIRKFVPVGRVGDMLLNPGKKIECFGEQITFPDIKLLYSIGGNPFHHNSDLNKFLQGWQRLETVVVHEPWWNPVAKHADIVLPATTTMERNDILANEHQRYWIAMHKVVEPVGGARNDFDILADVAQQLGLLREYTEGRDELGWLRHMYEIAQKKARDRGFSPPEFDQFWSVGRYEFPAPAVAPSVLREFRADPVRNRLATASGKIEIFSATIAGYGYDDCPPHPMWLEPAEWLGSRTAKRFPLHLLSNQPATRLHSQLDPGAVSRASKIKDREPIVIHPADAAVRDIEAGDIVKVFNDRGEFLAAAAVSDHLVPGVVQIATGAWYDPEEGGKPGTLEKHGNPNVVTMEVGTSKLSQGSVAQTALVNIVKYDRAPPVTAFERPQIVSS